MSFPGIDPILLLLIAFIIGLLLGRIWGYQKYRDRLNYTIRKARSSSSYVLGISNLIAGERELAISELARAAKTDTDRIELYIILGNLYREKGRLEKAIQIHRSVLHRKDLSRVDREMAQLALGLDFLRAGMLKRAREIFKEALRENPENIDVLQHLQKSYEEERNWKEAYRIQQKILRFTRSKDYSVSAFILAEEGIDKYRDGNFEEAIDRFEQAISLFEEAYSAYEFLGKTYLKMGQLRNAADAWETLVELVPDKAFLVLPDLYKIYRKLGIKNAIWKYRDYLLKKCVRNWRVHLFYASLPVSEEMEASSFEMLMFALKANLNSLAIHQTIWKLFLQGGLEIKDIKKYVGVTEELLFSDPFVCTRCQYRISEFKRRCPHCRRWDTFVEERGS